LQCIDLALVNPDVPTSTVRFQWARGRLFDKDVAQMFLARLTSARARHERARIVAVTLKQQERQKPLALNTVELMKIASSALGMSPAAAMNVAGECARSCVLRLARVCRASVHPRLSQLSAYRNHNVSSRF
jgi:hypothetical protein